MSWNRFLINSKTRTNRNICRGACFGLTYGRGSFFGCVFILIKSGHLSPYEAILTQYTYGHSYIILHISDFEMGHREWASGSTCFHMFVQLLDYSSAARRSAKRYVAIPFDTWQHTQLINETIFIIVVLSLLNGGHISVRSAQVIFDSFKKLNNLVCIIISIAF